MTLDPALRRDAQCLVGDPHSSRKSLARVALGPHAAVLPRGASAFSSPEGLRRDWNHPNPLQEAEASTVLGGTYPVHGDDRPLPVSVLQGLGVQLKARGHGYLMPWASEQRPGQAASPSPRLLHVQAESAAGLGRYLFPEAKRGPNGGPARKALEPQSPPAPRPLLPASQAQLGGESVSTQALHPAPQETLPSQRRSHPPWQPRGLGAVLLRQPPASQGASRSSEADQSCRRHFGKTDFNSIFWGWGGMCHLRAGDP